jgi:hypothetical protein
LGRWWLCWRQTADLRHASSRSGPGLFRRSLVWTLVEGGVVRASERAWGRRERPAREQVVDPGRAKLPGGPGDRRLTSGLEGRKPRGCKAPCRECCWAAEQKKKAKVDHNRDLLAARGVQKGAPMVEAGRAGLTGMTGPERGNRHLEAARGWRGS